MNTTIIKVKTRGKRGEDLSPDIVIPVGMNYAVHEYINNDKEAIVEIFGSEVIEKEKRKTKTDLDNFVNSIPKEKLIEKNIKRKSSGSQIISGDIITDSTDPTEIGKSIKPKEK